MESDLYNLLPNPDKNDEADPDMTFINPHSDYYSMSKVNNASNNNQGKGIFLFHCNIRSLTRKPNPFKCYVILTSTLRLNPNSNSNVYLGLSIYHLFHTDSPTTAGGTALYVTKDLTR